MFCSLFPNIVHLCEVQNFSKIQDDLVDFVYREKHESSDGVQKSNGGGWQSVPKYHSYENILNDTIISTLNNFFNDEDVWNGPINYKISTEWININKKGDFNFTHNHPGADLSGVLWIDVPGGQFSFDSPHNYNHWNHSRFYTEGFRRQTNCHASFTIEPSNGQMLIFPSAIYHAVSQNESDKDRISSSFNITLEDL